MSSPKRLHRTSSSGRIAGVCAGIAEYLDADVTLIRLGWVVLSIVPGCLIGGLIAYIAAWLIMPDSSVPADGETGTARHPLTRSAVDRRIAGVCGGLAEYLGVDATVVRVLWAVLTIIPGAIIAGVVAYVVAWFIMPADRAPHATVISPVT
jgi:phage shock protein PspC (stress-responsive transcriptional regulator)